MKSLIISLGMFLFCASPILASPHFTEEEYAKLVDFRKRYDHVHLPFYDAIVEINRSFAPTEAEAKTAHRKLFIPSDIKKRFAESTLIEGISLEEKERSKLFADNSFEAENILKDLSSHILQEVGTQVSVEVKDDSSQFVKDQNSFVIKNILSETIHPLKKQMVSDEEEREIMRNSLSDKIESNMSLIPKKTEEAITDREFGCNPHDKCSIM